MSLREDLVRSAVDFLRDASISDSPLNKRVEFLETKGLTLEEIQELLKRSQGESSKVGNDNSGVSAVEKPLEYYSNPPPIPERDWKDYFIMASATVGVTYGLYQIVSKYVVPNILPPLRSKIDEEKEAIDQEFTRIEKMLELMEIKQDEFIEKNNLKASKIDETLDNIDKIISKTNEKNLLNEERLKSLKLEVESMRSTMVSTLDSQKSAVLQELTSLEQELYDLKKILIQSDIKFPEKESVNGLSIQLKPEEKLKKLNIPLASSVPTAVDVLAKVSKDDQIPEWQRFADGVKLREEAEADEESLTQSLSDVSLSDVSLSLTQSLSDLSIPLWQLASPSDSIPSWQLRS